VKAGVLNDRSDRQIAAAFYIHACTLLLNHFDATSDHGELITSSKQESAYAKQHENKNKKHRGNSSKIKIEHAACNLDWRVMLIKIS
jgi:hypothetical protein